MAMELRKKKSRNKCCRFAALFAALLSLVCFIMPMNGSPLAPAARSAEVEEAGFDLTITDRDGIPVLDILTLEIRERNVPYLFRMTASGTEAGFCKVTISRDGKTEVRYIDPICPGDDITLAVYAAAGSQISFDCSQQEQVGPAEKTIAPAESILNEGVLQVCLEVSETPSLDCTVPQNASLEAIAAHYGVQPEDILRFNAVDSIQAGDVIAIPNPATREPYAEAVQAEAKPAETAQTEMGRREVPLYFQDDYPNVRYGAGTVKTSGCSVVSLAMVANAITGYDYAVDELAEYFGGRAENNIARLEKGSETLGLKFHKSKDWNESLAAVKQGKIVIALMDGIKRDCLFTKSQHFIILTGMTEDGERILVNDSSKTHYSLWNLKNGFQNGFLPEDILMGYSGGWIYEPTLEYQPERYQEERLIKSPENNHYPQLSLSAEDIELIARVVWAEARGECEEGQQAVAEVVLNRLASDKFSNNLHDVIYGEGQFRSVSVLKDAQPGQAQYQAIDRAIYGKHILPDNVYYFATFKTNPNVYQQIGNHIFCFG